MNYDWLHDHPAGHADTEALAKRMIQHHETMLQGGYSKNSRVLSDIRQSVIYLRGHSRAIMELKSGNRSKRTNTK